MSAFRIGYAGDIIDFVIIELNKIYLYLDTIMHN